MCKTFICIHMHCICVFIYIYIPSPHSWGSHVSFVFTMFFHVLLKQSQVRYQVRAFSLNKKDLKAFLRIYAQKNKKTHRNTKITCLGLKPKLLQKVLFLAASFLEVCQFAQPCHCMSLQLPIRFPIPSPAQVCRSSTKKDVFFSRI